MRYTCDMRVSIHVTPSVLITVQDDVRLLPALHVKPTGGIRHHSKGVSESTRPVRAAPFTGS